MFHQRQRRGLVVAVWGTIMVVLARYGFDRLVGPAPHLLLPFVVPIALAAWVGGRVSGVLATALNVGFVLVLLNTPDHGLDPANIGDWLRLALLAGIGLLLSLHGERLWQFREQMAHAAKEADARQATLELEISERKTIEELLRASEARHLVEQRRYRMLLEGVPQLVWTCRPDGQCDYLSPQWVAYTGLPELQQLGYGWVGAVHPDDRAPLLAAWDKAVAVAGPLDVEFRLRSHGGEYRWFRTRAIYFDDVDVQGKWFGTNTDVHEQKIAEMQLRELNATLEQRVAESQERFRNAFEYAAIGMAMVGLDGRWLQVNQAFCRMIGYTAADLLARDFQTITHPDDLATDLGYVEQLVAGTIHTYQMEKRYIHKDGHLIWCLLAVSLVRDPFGQPLNFVSQIKDITERKFAEEQIRVSLREKEVLLKEIHHRVKNNLQIVSALLDLQSGFTDDSTTLTMFRESQQRVKSMALIHERLYRSDDLAKINFNHYLKQLADDLYRNYKVAHEEIALELDIAVPPLPLDLAIPCGLLVNELVSNCFKHAFAGRRTGRIRIALRPADGMMNRLTVADDGVGFPAHLDTQNTSSFGMQLVATLAEQLHGHWEVQKTPGTTVTVTFPQDGR